jgi:hypothetical protein
MRTTSHERDLYLRPLPFKESKYILRNQIHDIIRWENSFEASKRTTNNRKQRK